MPGELSQADIAIWHTLAIEQQLADGSIAARPQAPTNFGLYQGEWALANGEFTLHEYHAGDGFYAPNYSRRAGGQAAVPRWVPIAGGIMCLTTMRMCFTEPTKHYQWGWQHISSGQLVGPRQFNFTGHTEDGRDVSWILESDWAELALILWARVQHPQHWQFAGRTWIPQGWTERALAAGYAIPGSSSRQIGY